LVDYITKMVNAFSGCTCNNTTGCGFNSGTGSCCTAVCCKEPTECNKLINEQLDKIVAYKLKLRLLRADFKKRSKSCCDTFKPMSNNKFQDEKCDLEKKIKKATKKIISLKRACKGDFLIRNPDSRCVRPTPCGCCKTKAAKCSD
jgi:hypothetical protein